MTTKILKEEIQKLLESNEDEALLQKILHILENGDEEETDWWDEMTDEQRAQQERAEEDIKLGKNLVPHEEAMKRARKWLE